MKDGSCRWLKLLPRAISTQHSWSRTELHGLKGLLKRVCKYVTAGAWLQQDMRKQSIREQGGSQEQFQESSGTRDPARGVRNFQKSVTYWFVLVLGLCLFGVFFPLEKGLDILSPFWQMGDSHHTPLTWHLLENLPFPWRIYPTFLDKAEVGCMRVSILEW